MDFHSDIIRALHQQTRRQFLKQGSLGLGALALTFLNGGCSDSSSKGNGIITDQNPFAPKPPHFPGRVKNVIYIHMAGAPSQLELFEYKPELLKLDGQLCPPSLMEGKRFAFIRGIPKMLGPQAIFNQHGESRAWISNLLPHLSTIADELTFLKAVHTDQFNHAPAQLLMHTGTPRLGRPSLGSWVTYGLGTENSNLPGFVVLTSGGNNPDAGKSVWGNGFLPSVYQGVHCRSDGDPVLFINNPSDIDQEKRKSTIDAINDINRLTYQEFKDAETLTRISQYELAYNMQITVPEVMNIADEPEYIHSMYGSNPHESIFANNALLARKLVERGVRFVQLFDWGWDTHGTSEDGSIDIGLVNKCRQTDKAVTALILDLKQRGLLDETLVIWGGEFGRTPMQENREGKVNPFKGRDHHAEAFTMWMAGGGLKKGFSYGETDEIGYSAMEGKVDPFDIQATILHLLGFDHERLTYPFQGRNFRLTDVGGRVIKEILA
ncbi:MAG: DUF1501 domain-containing protein [Cyclobacteriaceae bacterium]|nr:DUF1501 domain-containing protein [Cyclobacteriaceae bacterium]